MKWQSDGPDTFKMGDYRLTYYATGNNAVAVRLFHNGQAAGVERNVPDTDKGRADAVDRLRRARHA